MEITRRGLVAGMVGLSGVSGVTAVLLGATEGSDMASADSDRPGSQQALRDRRTSRSSSTDRGTAGSTPTDRESTVRETPSRTPTGRESTAPGTPTPVDPPSVTFGREYDLEDRRLSLTLRNGTFTHANTDHILIRSGRRRQERTPPIEPGARFTVTVQRGTPIEVVWHGPDGRSETIHRIDTTTLVDRPEPWPAFEATYDDGQVTFTHAGGPRLGRDTVEKVLAMVGTQRRAALSPPVARGDSLTVQATEGEQVQIGMTDDDGWTSLGTYYPGDGGWRVTPPSATWSFSPGSDEIEVCHEGGATFREDNTVQLAIVVDGRPRRQFRLPTHQGACRTVEADSGARVEVVWTASRLSRSSVVASYGI